VAEAMGTQVTSPDYHYGMGEHVVLLGQKWIPRDEKCISSARRFVRDIAVDWYTTEEVPDIAELLASEIVTNALVHGAVDFPTSSTLRVAVGRDGPVMTVDVYDSCITVPELRRVDSLETSGRGLAIVETLSLKWGWNLHRHGKSVWFQLAAWS
jgi:anti-sigma regulatory factor (Ser/Thr protein kinase)